jgi:penicillin-binding protein 1A
MTPIGVGTPRRTTAEDGDFYRHPGIDIPLMLRAAVIDLSRLASDRRPLGASTITQQVVKNLPLSDEGSLSRKIKEILLSLRLERELSKDRILEIYLNEVYLGCGAYGIGEAASQYFDKPVNALALGEAAFLAGLPKAPNHYDPARFPEAAKARRDWVIDRMAEDGYVTSADASQTKETPIIIANLRPSCGVAPRKLEAPPIEAAGKRRTALAR